MEIFEGDIFQNTKNIIKPNFMETITRKITMESIAPQSTIREVNKPTLSQIRFQRRYGRRSLYNEMRELEKQFSWCVKNDEPARWFRLQDELGDIYRRVMKYHADHNIGSK
jgi:hypothetical protein